MTRVLETRKVVWKITEWRDECVYKTKEVGEVWIPIGLTFIEENAVAKEHGGDFLGSVSTHDQMPIVRSRKVLA